MKYFSSRDSIDCGPTCLKMVSDHYGVNISIEYLRRICNISRLGVSLYNLSEAADKIGFKSIPAQSTFNYLIDSFKAPCILFWDKNHFVVLYKITKVNGLKFHVADPGVGKIKLDEETFRKYWLDGMDKGFGLFLEPTTRLNSDIKDEADFKEAKKSPFYFLKRYFAQYKGNYLQVIFLMGVSVLTSILLPFLTQLIVDYGVKLKDLNFVALILFFQMYLFITSTTADLVRSQLLMHISARINISILGDFLKKMMKLPIKFFESKMPSDLVQRMQDHAVIETFITTTLLNTFFSIINLIVFCSILFYYSPLILLVFVSGSLLSIGWALFFLKRKKSLNYVRFRELSITNGKLFETASNISEIKINGFELHKQNEWTDARAKLFKLELSNLKLDQYQRIGSELFEQIRTIVIMFFAVTGVIEGNLSIGMMLAVSYLMGQLNIPIKELIRFINTYQTAAISTERMNEVYMEKDEEDVEHVVNSDTHSGLELSNVSFGYLGEQSEKVLKDISFKIPQGKITAIVGSSGSGKTTLIKLLLRFYKPDLGQINLSNNDFESYSIKWWREQCGVVMQEGHLFSDTIKRNIVMSDDSDDKQKLISAIKIANIEEFVNGLPMGLDTKVGDTGLGISTGQKQRLLIARAVYKNPNYLFFDEATSSLDTKNERIIMENLKQFFDNKTVLIVAHRLSTVKNADQIIVLDQGRVVEVGTHLELITKQNFYYTLVKNQLELNR